MYADKICYIEILAPYSSNNKQESFIPHPAFGVNADETAVRMNIQPATAQQTLLVEGEIGKTFIGFTTSSGIVEGMRVTVSGTNQAFIVRGRQNYDYGPLQHNALTLFRRDP